MEGYGEKDELALTAELESDLANVRPSVLAEELAVETNKPAEAGGKTDVFVSPCDAPDPETGNADANTARTRSAEIITHFVSPCKSSIAGTNHWDYLP